MGNISIVVSGQEGEVMRFDFQSNPGLHFTERFFRQVIAQNFDKVDVERIEMGLSLAKKAHDGQFRADGSAYIVHPIRVALLVLESEPSATADMIISALLHDALEDSDLSADEVKRSVGEKAAEYVLKLTRYRPDDENPELRRQGKLKKWQVTMQSVYEVRVVKTCDYLDNIISLKFISRNRPGFRKIPRWLMEAETMYLPLARITNQIAFRLLKSEVEFYKAQGHEVGNWYSDTL